jgi:hypothetical protein
MIAYSTKSESVCWIGARNIRRRIDPDPNLSFFPLYVLELLTNTTSDRTKIRHQHQHPVTTRYIGAFH